MVELCVARNRRRSAHCCKGIAKITSRQARKGFQLRYNPDNHWSAALYQNLNFLEYTDGRNIVNVYCDDAVFFRKMQPSMLQTSHFWKALMVYKVCTHLE